MLTFKTAGMKLQGVLVKIPGKTGLFLLAGPKSWGLAGNRQLFEGMEAPRRPPGRLGPEDQLAYIDLLAAAL